MAVEDPPFSVEIGHVAGGGECVHPMRVRPAWIGLNGTHHCFRKRVRGELVDATDADRTAITERAVLRRAVQRSLMFERCPTVASGAYVGLDWVLAMRLPRAKEVIGPPDVQFGERLRSRSSEKDPPQSVVFEQCRIEQFAFNIDPASWLAATRMAPACWRLRSGRSPCISSSSE